MKEKYQDLLRMAWRHKMRAVVDVESAGRSGLQSTLAAISRRNYKLRGTPQEAMALDLLARLDKADNLLARSMEAVNGALRQDQSAQRPRAARRQGPDHQLQRACDYMHDQAWRRWQRMSALEQRASPAIARMAMQSRYFLGGAR